MSMRAVHLNLLQPSERLSSMPVRLKVVLPIVFAALLVAMLGWWGLIALQLGQGDNELKGIADQIGAGRAAYLQANAKRVALEAKLAEVDQLKGYLNSRLEWGGVLKVLAETVPAGIQLTEVSVIAPPPVELKPRPGVKEPPLKGPTNTFERVDFVLAGKTARAGTLYAFLDAVKAAPAFQGVLVFSDKAEAGAELSPRKRKNYGQDGMMDTSGEQLIGIDLEYSTKGRVFEP